MKSTILRSGVALACALGLAACGGGSGDLYLQGGVQGVTKDGLVLQNNGGHDTAVVVDSTGRYSSFTFADRISTDDEFNITVKAVPSNVEKCEVRNGHSHANYYTIQQVAVVCTIKVHKLTVTVNGLTKPGLVLVNGADRVPVNANATTADMAPVYEDAAYGMDVLTQPQGQT